jgi:broad specificity phosphatase PhoE
MNEVLTPVKDLVLLRHGFSNRNASYGETTYDSEEAREVGMAYAAQLWEALRHIPDSHVRLEFSGLAQAEAAGKWISEEFPNGFDAYESSPYARAIETAGTAAVAAGFANSQWRLEDDWREQDWGMQNTVSEEGRDHEYHVWHSEMEKKDRWHWRPFFGESRTQDVRTRVEKQLQRLNHVHGGKSVLVVSHGGTISTARYSLEHLDPIEWNKQEASGSYNISNCQIIHYTAQNPFQPADALVEELRWRRSICPWDPARSWDEGKWVEIPKPVIYTPTQLLQLAAEHPPAIEQ